MVISLFSTLEFSLFFGQVILTTSFATTEGTQCGVVVNIILALGMKQRRCLGRIWAGGYCRKPEQKRMNLTCEGRILYGTSVSRSV